MPRRLDPSTGTLNATIRVNSDIYNELRSQGVSIPDITNIAMEGYLGATSFRLTQLEEEYLKCREVYDRLSRERIANLKRKQDEKLEIAKAEKNEKLSRNKKIADIYNIFMSAPEKFIKRFKSEYESGNLDDVVDTIIIAMVNQTEYSREEIEDALSIICRNGWKAPE